MADETIEEALRRVGPAWFEIGALDASQLHIGKAPAKAAE